MTSKLIVKSIRHTGASADAITMDASGNVTFPANATCSGTATGFGVQGITMVDNWYINSALSVPSGEATITANWERGTSDQFGRIGSAMTQSSGVFTFHSTGIYYCSINGGFYRGTGYRRYIGWTIKTTSDNSSYTHAVINYDSISGDTNSNVSAAVSATCVFDVTDTSTHKMTFQTDAVDSGAAVTGVSGRYANVLFIRLGDT